MAKFHQELPNDLIKELEKHSVECEKMFSDMVKEAGEVVYNRVVSNVEKVFESTDSLMKGLKLTKVYKTPSDDGINIHIGFYGYNDKGVPIPLIAMAREYGTSRGEAKKPFLKKSFRKKEIESIMLKVQERYLKK